MLAVTTLCVLLQRCACCYSTVLAVTAFCTDGSYYHSCYRRLAWDYSWEAARDECHRWGGHLAMIDSTGENDYVHDIFFGTLYSLYNVRNDATDKKMTFEYFFF